MEYQRATLEVRDSLRLDRKTIWSHIFQGSACDVPEGDFDVNLFSSEGFKLVKDLKNNPRAYGLSAGCSIEVRVTP